MKLMMRTIVLFALMMSGTMLMAQTLPGTQFDNITPYDSNADGDKAFDGNTATYVDANDASGAYTGLDFGSSKTVSIIKFYPRENWAARMNEGKFQE
jgi:hypothetical protein